MVYASQNIQNGSSEVIVPLYKALIRPQDNSAYACTEKTKTTQNPKGHQTEKLKNKASKIISGMESIIQRKTAIALAFSVNETVKTILLPSKNLSGQ